MKSLIALFLSCTCAISAPAWVADLSPAKLASHPPIAPSKLGFRLSWKGMVNAGSLSIEFAPKGEKKPGSMVIKSSASSEGAAAVLFPYKHSYWCEIYPTTLASRYFHSIEEDSEEKVVTTNRHVMSRVTVEEVTTNAETGAVSRQSFLFAYGAARDVFSAMLYIRGQKLAIGEEHTLLLLPFKTPYLLKVRVEAKEKHLGRDTLRLSFALRKINRKTLELGTYKKLKKPVSVWLSDDADRIPIELRASAYIGDVRAVLINFSKNP
jgi:hypothetical protein